MAVTNRHAHVDRHTRTDGRIAVSLNAPTAGEAKYKVAPAHIAEAQIDQRYSPGGASVNLHLIDSSLDSVDSAPKWHLGRIICSCNNKRPTQQTDRHTDTDHGTCDIAVARI